MVKARALRLWITLALLGGLAACGAESDAAAGAQALPPELVDVLAGQVDCGGSPLVQVRQHRYDFTGDAVEDALLAVRCDTGAGAPPSTVLAVAATPDGPEVVDELLASADGEVVNSLAATGPTAVVGTFAFSPEAPRCCPDLAVTHRYRWDGTAFDAGSREATPLPSAGPS